MNKQSIEIKDITNQPKAEYRKIMHNGLWKNNPAIVQLLGLCPLLAVSNNVVNALGLGIATLFVLILTNTLVSLFKNITPHEIRIPIFVMLIATMVGSVEILMRAFINPLYQSLGIFIPLIVTNCIIMGRAESFAYKNKILPAIIDAVAMGLGLLIVLVILGGFREMLGNGTLFSQMDSLFGEFGKSLEINFHLDNTMLIAILPPGAFIALGLLLALKNYIDKRK